MVCAADQDTTIWRPYLSALCTSEWPSRAPTMPSCFRTVNVRAPHVGDGRSEAPLIRACQRIPPLRVRALTPTGSRPSPADVRRTTRRGYRGSRLYGPNSARPQGPVDSGKLLRRPIKSWAESTPSLGHHPYARLHANWPRQRFGRSTASTTTVRCLGPSG